MNYYMGWMHFLRYAVFGHSFVWLSACGTRTRSWELVIWVWIRLIWRRATLCNRGLQLGHVARACPGIWLWIWTCIWIWIWILTRISVQPVPLQFPTAVPPRILAFAAQNSNVRRFFRALLPIEIAICAINLPANRRNRLAHGTRPAIDTSAGPSRSPYPSQLPPSCWWTRNGIGKC